MKIVCLSNSPWHGQPLRPQQLMRRLENHRILFFDPPPSKAAGGVGQHTWKDESIQAAGHIDVFSLPPFPGWMEKHPLFNRRVMKKQAAYINRQLTAFAAPKPVLWLCSPVHADLPELVEHTAVIFDCPPRLLEEGETSEKTVELAEKASVVLSSSEDSCRELRKYNENTYLVPNGSHFELFNRANEYDLPFPDDLFNVKNPLFGFIGTVTENVDLSLVEFAAKARPEWSFVFLGDVACDLTQVEGLRNVHMLGAKPLKELPQYVRLFDACLNIFKNKTVDNDVSSMKFYEYLSSGKPIVSTPHPTEVMDYADVLYLAGTPEEFTEACRKAAGEHDSWKTRQRVTYGRAASWDARVSDIERILKERGIG